MPSVASLEPGVVGAEGFEPSNTGFKVPRLTAWPRPSIGSPAAGWPRQDGRSSSLLRLLLAHQLSKPVCKPGSLSQPHPADGLAPGERACQEHQPVGPPN